MPVTRRSMESGALRPISDNVPPPLTPGKQVVALKAELQKKDAENDALRSSIAELTNALAGLSVVKDKIEADATASAVDPPKKKKDKNAPVPAKTAYKFYCDAHPKPKEGVNMLHAWKACSPEIRQSYESMAKADKDRYARELKAYEEEKAALEMYYGKKRQDMAMELLDAHLTAQAALEKSGADKKGKKKRAKKDPEAPKRPLSSYMYFVGEMRDSAVKANPDASPAEVMKILGEMWSKLEKGRGGENGTRKYDDLAAEDRARYEVEKGEYDAMVKERTEQSEREKIERLNQDKEEAIRLMRGALPQDAGTSAAAGAVKVVNVDDMSAVSDLTAAKPNDPTAAKPKKKKDPNAPKRAVNAYLFFSNESRNAIKAEMPEGTGNRDLLTEIGRRWKALADGEKEKYEVMAREDKERYAREMERYGAEKK